MKVMINREGVLIDGDGSPCVFESEFHALKATVRLSDRPRRVRHKDDVDADVGPEDGGRGREAVSDRNGYLRPSPLDEALGTAYHYVCLRNPEIESVGLRPEELGPILAELPVTLGELVAEFWHWADFQQIREGTDLNVVFHDSGLTGGSAEPLRALFKQDGIFCWLDDFPHNGCAHTCTSIGKKRVDGHENDTVARISEVATPTSTSGWFLVDNRLRA